jgi:hypothetical protein
MPTCWQSAKEEQMKIVLAGKLRAAFVLAVMTAGGSLSALSHVPAQKTPSADAGAQLLGNWRGDSICQVKPSSCNDEKALYHISCSPDDPNLYLMRMDKIADGKPVTMGTLDYTFDKEKGTLTHEDSRSVWKFTVKGNKMEGTLTIPTKVIYRKISLTKE